MVYLESRYFESLGYPPIQIPTQNGDMKVLFNKFNRRINLMALLFTILGSRNKKPISKYKKLTH
jgi:hypothetical protein